MESLSTNKQSDELKVISRNEDAHFGFILDRYGVPYSFIDGYWQVGETQAVQGWIIHVSIIRSQLVDFLNIVVPILVQSGLVFRIPMDKEVARQVLDGEMGMNQVGKVVKVFFPEVNKDLAIVKNLIQLSTGFRGPKVFTDYHLGGCVYVRYGAISPVVMSDVAGNRINYIYDVHNELVKDEYSIPFAMPSWISWPFEEIKQLDHLPSQTLIADNYKPIRLLKLDAKGIVLKCLYLRYKFLPTFCILKEGRLNMWADEQGRDMTDRIKWQQKVLNELKPHVRVPNLIDVFEVEGNLNMVMEEIKGRTLDDEVKSINKYCECWNMLDLARKQRVVALLFRLLKAIAIIHKCGYVHRDITPGNFIVEGKNIVPIDIEMAHSIPEVSPFPPFGRGTRGYISLEQQNYLKPTFKEDVYAIGGTACRMFTQLHPTSFEGLSDDQKKESLNFFVNDEELSGLIVNCWSDKPENRPELTIVEDGVKRYSLRLSGTSAKFVSLNRDIIDQLVEGAINGLANEPTLIAENLWGSSTISQDRPDGNRSSFDINPGLANGVAGISYVLSRAHRLGYSIGSCLELYQTAWQYIEDTMFSILPNVTPGLYGGAAGVAVSLANGVAADVVPDTEQIRETLYRSLNLPSYGIDLATGAAGQGLSVLLCREFLTEVQVTELLGRFDEQILSSLSQPSILKDMGSSIGNGYSGILLYLLNRLTVSPNRRVELLANELIETVMNDAVKFEKMIKKVGCHECFAVGVKNGFIGISLALIKSYELFGEARFQKMFERMHSHIPMNIVHENLNQDTGLSALGEVYLEALRIFKNEQWLRRAEWIAALFHNLSIGTQGESVYWRMNNSHVVTADLMDGNSGILHFLMRIINPEHLKIRVIG